MHLQFANKRRLLAKHVWYRMIEHLRWPGRTPVTVLNSKYDQALDETDIHLAQIWGSSGFGVGESGNASCVAA